MSNAPRPMNRAQRRAAQRAGAPTPDLSSGRVLGAPPGTPPTGPAPAPVRVVGAEVGVVEITDQDGRHAALGLALRVVTGPGDVGMLPPLLWLVDDGHDLAGLTSTLVEGAAAATARQAELDAEKAAAEAEEVEEPVALCRVCDRRIFGDLIAGGICRTCADLDGLEDRLEAGEIVEVSTELAEKIIAPGDDPAPF